LGPDALAAEVGGRACVVGAWEAAAGERGCWGCGCGCSEEGACEGDEDGCGVHL